MNQVSSVQRLLPSWVFVQIRPDAEAKWIKLHSWSERIWFVGGVSGPWGSQYPLFAYGQTGTGKTQRGFHQAIVESSSLQCFGHEIFAARHVGNLFGKTQSFSRGVFSSFDLLGDHWSSSMWSGSFGEASGADEGPTWFICKTKLIWWKSFSRFNEIAPSPKCMSEANHDHGDPGIHLQLYCTLILILLQSDLVKSRICGRHRLQWFI